MTKLKIVNLVAALDLNVKIDLNMLMEKNPMTDIQYEPSQFPGAVVRIKNPKTSYLVFGNGKLICTGAKTLEQIKESFPKLKNIIIKTGVDIKKIPEITIINMVVTKNMKTKLDLNKLAMKLKNVEFEPEQFPALIYKTQKPKVSFLIFSNGQIICAGAKKLEVAREAMKKLKEKLYSLNL